MFEGKELKSARRSASNKHELYVEMREMYVKLSETYVKIRMAVDELISECSPDDLMRKYIKLYVSTDVISDEYSMPMLLADGHILTLQDPWTERVSKTNADVTKGFYIDNYPIYLWNYEDFHFSRNSPYKYYDVETIQGQLEWDEVLDEYYRPVSSLSFQLENTSILRFLKRKILSKQLENAQQLYEEKKNEAAGWFENGVTADEVATIIFTQHGIRKRKYASDYPLKKHKMQKDMLPIKRPKNLTESDEIAYWKSYERQLDKEIQDIRRYIPAADDAYIAYEAYINGVDKSQLQDLCHNDVSLYRFWLSVSCVAYFKHLTYESEIYRSNQAESRKKRARFLANVTSFGAYHVEDGCVTGTDPFMMADIMSSKYGSINKRAQRAFNSDIEHINEKWKRFALE